MMPIEETIEELQRYLLEEREHELPNGCLICGNRPFFTSHIEKSNPNRMILYSLCLECYETTGKDNPDLLEHCGEC